MKHLCLVLVIIRMNNETFGAFLQLRQSAYAASRRAHTSGTRAEERGGREVQCLKQCCCGCSPFRHIGLDCELALDGTKRINLVRRVVEGTFLGKLAVARARPKMTHLALRHQRMRTCRGPACSAKLGFVS
jgi:hypothetical protein